MAAGDVQTTDVGREALPLVCGYLTCIGDERDGHTFFVTVEGAAPGVALIRGDEVRQPWLRATCSCGWKATDDERFTIVENAHHLWLQHVEYGARSGVGTAPAAREVSDVG